MRGTQALLPGEPNGIQILFVLGLWTCGVDVPAVQRGKVGIASLALPCTTYLWCDLCANQGFGDDSICLCLRVALPFSRLFSAFCFCVWKKRGTYARYLSEEMTSRIDLWLRSQMMHLGEQGPAAALETNPIAKERRPTIISATSRSRQVDNSDSGSLGDERNTKTRRRHLPLPASTMTWVP